MTNRTLLAVFASVFLLTVIVGSWRNGTLGLHGMFSGATGSTSTRSAASRPASRADSAAQVDLSSVARPRNSTDSPDSDGPTVEAPYPVDDRDPPSMLDPASTEVPVLVAVENSTGGARRTATMRNLGSEVLNVRVTSVNPPAGSRSVVQVSIAPRAEVNLTEAGLVVATGAELSIESPPYLSQRSTVY